MCLAAPSALHLGDDAGCLTDGAVAGTLGASGKDCAPPCAWGDKHPRGSAPLKAKPHLPPFWRGASIKPTLPAVVGHPGKAEHAAMKCWGMWQLVKGPVWWPRDLPAPGDVCFLLCCASQPHAKPHARTAREERAAMHLRPNPHPQPGMGHLDRPHHLPAFLLQINVLRNRVSDHQKV